MLFIRRDVLESWENLTLPAHSGQRQALSFLEPAGWGGFSSTYVVEIHQACHSGKGGISTSCVLTFPLEGEQKRQFTPVPISWVWGPLGSPVVWAKVMCLVFQSDWMASVTVDSTGRCLWNPGTFHGLLQHPLPRTIFYTPSSSSSPLTQAGQIMFPRLYFASYILFLSLIFPLQFYLSFINPDCSLLLPVTLAVHWNILLSSSWRIPSIVAHSLVGTLSRLRLFFFFLDV